MIVLVDEETASAAELFACALRDYDKAELVGVQTYGKGSMQELFPFKDGSAINLTTALYNPCLLYTSSYVQQTFSEFCTSNERCY